MKQIKLLDINYVDLGAHLGGTHLQPDKIEADPEGEADRVRRAAEEAGVGVADLFPTFGNGFRDRPANSPDAEVRKANRERFSALIRFAKLVGAPGITILPGVVWKELGPDKSFELAVQGLTELVDQGRSAGLRVSIEPHLESVVEEPERALELVRAVPGLQFTLDYTHFLGGNIDIERVHPLVEYAGHVHARQAKPGELQSSSAEGTLDYEDIVRRLRDSNYKGYISVEYTWQEWRGCNKQDVISESIILRDQLRSYLGQTQSPQP